MRGCPRHEAPSCQSSGAETASGRCRRGTGNEAPWVPEVQVAAEGMQQVPRLGPLKGEGATIGRTTMSLQVHEQERFYH